MGQSGSSGPTNYYGRVGAAAPPHFISRRYRERPPRPRLPIELRRALQKVSGPLCGPFGSILHQSWQFCCKFLQFNQFCISFFEIGTSLSASDAQMSATGTQMSAAGTCLSAIHTCLSATRTCLSATRTCLSATRTCLSATGACLWAADTSLPGAHTRLSVAHTGLRADHLRLSAIGTVFSAANIRL
jgi:hypothetical protein